MVETVRCAGVSSDDMPSEPCSSYVEERSVDADRATDTTVGLPSLKHRFQDGGIPLGEDDGRLQYVVHHGACHHPRPKGSPHPEIDASEREVPP